MDYPQSQQSRLLELDAWTDIIHSENWRVFLKLLRSHKDYLQQRVNEYLSKHEDRKAGEELAKLTDCDKLINIISVRIEELKKGGE